ncbi:MAG: phosphoribosylformylglycinamidine synthase I [Candidatus Doudnabacteria bacterium]|nr:phosphoribosylformylglycinamidine synthase I [Candidatus Doudnabacteria bacterium]
MKKIAVIQFPGINCEYEGRRALRSAGLAAEFFRWNQDASELKNYDAFYIPGGFSYEDRIRSGAIAARDPIMDAIKLEAAKGKPVLGICNGAQILVEAGLIPGLDQNRLGASLAANNRGYLNIWVSIRNESEPGRTVFNNFPKGHEIRLPIAHGEGRFVIPQNLLDQLIANGQTVFRYLVNPNGAVYNLAGVSNPEGNVLALMPHPERTKDGQVIFESLKGYLEGKFTLKPGPNLSFQPQKQNLEKFAAGNNSFEMLVDLIITDNEAESLQTTLEQSGLRGLKVKRFTHWELGIDDRRNFEKLSRELIASGEILNTNKETAYLDRSRLFDNTKTILVRDNEDFIGQGKLAVINHRLGINEINSVKRGVVWQINASDADWDKILQSNILFNPYSQTGYLF